MASEWSNRKFGDVLDGKVRNGIYKSNEFHGKGVKIINMGELFDNPRLSTSIEMKMLDVNTDELRRFNIKTGDLLFARRSLTAEGAGKCILVKEAPDQAVFESSLIRARVNEDISDSQYLYYYFNSPIGKVGLSSILRQVAVSGITGSDLMDLEIYLPPLPIQRQIAAILSKFDDKIELNCRMNRTLEQLARALFKSWFVDFAPVRAKMRGEQPDGMDAETAALFPDELVELDGREVPKGWLIGKARDFADISIGKTPPRKEAQWFTSEVGNRVWVSIRDMSGQGIYIYDSSEYLTEEAVDRFNVKKVPENSVLLSFKLTLGRVRITRGIVCTNEAIAHFSFDKNYKATYCYFSLDLYDYSGLGSTSSIATAVNSQIIKDMPFLLPTDTVIKAFDLRVVEILQRAEIADRESICLAQLRDTLLPRLLSGELDITSWADEAEQVPA